MGGRFVPGRQRKQWRRICGCFLSCSSFLAIANLTTSGPARGQTASTGALAGVVLDPSGVVLPGAALNLVPKLTREQQEMLMERNRDKCNLTAATDQQVNMILT